MLRNIALQCMGSAVCSAALSAMCFSRALVDAPCVLLHVLNVLSCVFSVACFAMCSAMPVFCDVLHDVCSAMGSAVAQGRGRQGSCCFFVDKKEDVLVVVREHGGGCQRGDMPPPRCQRGDMPPPQLEPTKVETPAALPSRSTRNVALRGKWSDGSA